MKATMKRRNDGSRSMSQNYLDVGKIQKRDGLMNSHVHMNALYYQAISMF